MTTRTNDIPDLIDTSPAGLRNWVKNLKTSIAVLARKTPVTDSGALDGAVTFRDLIDAGIAIEAPKGAKSKILNADGSGSMTPPPAPSGLDVERQPYKMLLSWDAPTYENHQAVEIWRNTENNLTTAYLVARWEGANFYEDAYNSSHALYYWIRFISKADIASGFNDISGTGADAQPGDVGGLTYLFEGFGVRLKWNKVLDPDLDAYEIRLGATWESAALIESTKTTNYLWPVQTSGVYRIWLRARDVSGYYSGSATSVDITVLSPAQTSLTAAILGESFALSWNPISGTFAMDYYIIKEGADWDTADVIDHAFTTAFYSKVTWSGTKRFWVAAKDVAGNVASPTSVDIVVLNPSAVIGLRAEVVDNNVLLYWDASTGTLPVITYEVWRGDIFSTAFLVGTKAGLFTSLFEQLSGTYTYWVRPVDSAGNYGTEVAVTTKVNQPPDYILYSDLNVDLATGVLDNADFDGTGIVLPFDDAETWADHYDLRSWTNDDDAIAAGFPIYAQPTPGTGKVTFEFDYGVDIPPTGLVINPTLLTIADSPTWTCFVSWRLLDTDPWSTVEATSAFIASTFRYIKVEILVGNGGTGHGLMRLSALNVKLNVKQKTLGGQGQANAGDSGGTQFDMTVDGVILSVTGDTTNASATISGISDMTGIRTGMAVQGAGIPDGTRVVSVGVSSVTMSAEASATASGVALRLGEAFFLDCLGPPVIQPLGSAARIAMVDFQDVPNPLSFKVLVFDLAGVRQTASISWLSRGV